MKTLVYKQIAIDVDTLISYDIYTIYCRLTNDKNR